MMFRPDTRRNTDIELEGEVALPKPKTFFACQECGHQASSWMGRCPGCGQWNTLVEERNISTSQNGQRRGLESSGAPCSLPEITLECFKRIPCKIEEFDRVLGGGVVPGGLVLIGGDPGIGKSTLLLQACADLAHNGTKVLYVSGEESQQQIKLRAERLSVAPANLFVLAETALETIQEHLRKLKPQVFVLDSVQTAYSSQLQSAPGSISQVREVAAQLLFYSKQHHLATFIVGHVTKDGAIAGPRTLEHIVDTVLYLEGDRYHSYRILRAVKNRFGSTNEIGVFEMGEQGMEEIKNPSQLFLAERSEGISGSVAIASLEGTRPILLEVQALVSPSNMAMPRRATTGVDGNRLSLLTAVMEKRLGMHLQAEDIFVNVAGGLRAYEPAADLGVSCAIISSFRNCCVEHDWIVMGEVGLGGEIRGISQLEVRLKEAAKLGFKRALVPQSNLEKFKAKLPIEITGVRLLSEAAEVLV